MIGYLIRRVIQSIVVVLGVLLIVFLLAQVIPGGEARAVLGTKATVAKIHQFNVLNGFTLPIWDQFYQYLLRLVVHQNLGYSYSYNQTVSALISAAARRASAGGPSTGTPGAISTQSLSTEAQAPTTRRPW